MSVKELYKELSKKHKLPDFAELNNEFEISSIEAEKEEFLLREVRRKITEKLEAYANILEEVLQPDTNLSTMYEAGIFDEKERNGLFDIYKKFMFLCRLSVEASIDEDDKKSSDFINAVFRDWGAIKKHYLFFIKKAKESWLKTTSVEEKLKYMG
jgi:hypothetical protein